jgi:hypothetical protein
MAWKNTKLKCRRRIMKKRMQRILKSVIPLVLCVILLSSCQGKQSVNQTTHPTPTTQETPTTVPTTKTEKITTGTTGTTGTTSEAASPQKDGDTWTHFDSISNFIDLIEEATDKLDDATSDIDSFSVVGDMLFAFQVSGMIHDAGLEHALNGSKDTYISEIKEAPNESGTYTSSVTLDGDFYFFGYDFTYNDGKTSYIKLSYNPSLKRIVAERMDADGKITQAHYFATDEALFVSYGDSMEDRRETNQMLICQVGEHVYYAIRKQEAYDSEPLPVDILDVMPTDWESFAANFDYQRMLKVEDGQAEFIENEK